MRTALLDLDGTVADYDGAMNAALTEMRSPEEPPIAFSRDAEPPWMKARRDAIARRPGFWRDLLPLKNGFQIYKLLLDLGFEVHVLTKGPSSKSAAWMEKVDWVRDHLPGTELTITEDKSKIYGRVLVDDWPKYAEPWLAIRRRGLVIMPDQPEWNANFQHPRVIRYRGNDDWAQARAALIRARDRAEGEPLVLPTLVPPPVE